MQERRHRVRAAAAAASHLCCSSLRGSLSAWRSVIYHSPFRDGMPGYSAESWASTACRRALNGSGRPSTSSPSASWQRAMKRAQSLSMWKGCHELAPRGNKRPIRPSSRGRRYDPALVAPRDQHDSRNTLPTWVEESRQRATLGALTSLSEAMARGCRRLERSSGNLGTMWQRWRRGLVRARWLEPKVGFVPVNDVGPAPRIVADQRSRKTGPSTQTARQDARDRFVGPSQSSSGPAATMRDGLRWPCVM